MNRFKILFQMLQKLRVIVPNEYKKRIPILFVTMIISSILEMLGIAVVMPFMTTLTDADTLMKKWYIVLFMNVFGINNFYNLLLWMGILVVIIYVLKNVVLLLTRNYQNVFQCGIQSVMSTEMLEHCTMRPYSFFLDVNSSELLTNIFSDGTNVYNIIGAFLALTSESLTVLLIAVFIFMTDPIMALGLVILAVICVFLIVFGFKKLSIESGVKYRNSYSKMYQDAMQTIDGIKEIDVTGRGKYFISKFDANRKKFRDSQIILNFLNLVPERVVETLFISGIILVLVFRVRWGMDAQSSIVTLSAFAVAGYRLLPSINKLSTNMTNLIYYQPSLEAAYNNIVGARQSEKERIEYINSHALMEEKVKDKRFEDEVTIEKIDFSYGDDKSKKVLENLNLTIKKGKSIAFIGESGAGKSTLSDILLGLLMPQKGSVYMDGIDIFTISSKWNQIVGYVPQSVYLLDATIKENIAFGIDSKDISDEKVWEALSKAQLDSYIKSLPDGLDTFVGERGVRLSGGQRQRIAIARALYNDPDILILDEATSALDNETEKAVMESIDALHGHKTLVIVAHRLSTISECDEIFEIKNGKAIERKKEEVLGGIK
ncbi:ABC-type multidrug transport system, ATPase and permease component [Butyrivibrio fibrisolvens]|uniref:ABC-type multidrug transport system, ATPase and permease component n=1 Tax=Butyrivibrio fibrisolvens TaxID=831 RepID=A0A1H9Q1Z7_BUTFI|nr:ABC transporter ATP-binding protein [Butyrivibrio fibrisolvens]SER54105.1 ABC-type multidrug transport system, ATPase and permease component [Butyrivibrio fibrisolvens]